MNKHSIMAVLKFKTNINCGGCIAKVTPFVNQIQGVAKWEVDTNNPDKILSIEGDMSISDVIAAVQKVGFKIEAL